MKNKIKIIAILVFSILLVSTVVFGESNYFTIKIPKGYLVAQDSSGPTKLVAEREDKKINFNIQVLHTDKYYEYSKKGLNDLINIASKEMDAYEVNDVKGEIGEINNYPCYDLNYRIIAKETQKEMYVRQIYIYEDTYTYTITFGGESEKLLNDKEIQEALNTFTIEHYKRDNVEELEEEKVSLLLIVMLSVLGLCIFIFLVVIIIRRARSNKKIKNNKIKTINEK